MPGLVITRNWLYCEVTQRPQRYHIEQQNLSPVAVCSGRFHPTEVQQVDWTRVSSQHHAKGGNPAECRRRNA